jgi:Helicase HerA, central domain
VRPSEAVRPAEAVSVRGEGRYPARSLLYRTLAQALVGTRPPAGAVFESTLDDPVPWVSIRPPYLLGDLRNPSLPGVRISAGGPVRPSLEPPPGTLDRLGVLVPAGATPTPRGDRSVLPPAPPSLSWCGPVGGWAGVQSFWLHPGTGRVHVAVRFRVAARTREACDRLFDAIGARLLGDWVRATAIPAAIRPLSPWARRDWRGAGVRSLPREGWCSFDARSVEETAELGLRDLEAPPLFSGSHTVVFGASGTGKTTYLASRAARTVARGGTVVVIDLHGDLAPSILARLPTAGRERVVVVDAGERPVAGIAGLVGTDDSVERAAGHFVAAVKRLSPDGADLAWGFRLERIFDTFARLVLDSGGSLTDLYALLTDPRRRDAALLGAPRASTARFLEELGPIVRRNPEFLWSAATRLSKVVLVPELTELLAPVDGGLDVERLVRDGRSLFVRLPVARLGPEAAAFAATLVLSRIYLGLASAGARDRAGEPVLLVLDEVQSFSPRLVSEILSESRKFGLEALVATQYPDRLAPELRAAAAGAAGRFVTFRIPPASTLSVGPWVGLSHATGASELATLPVGLGVLRDAHWSVPRWVSENESPIPVDSPNAWSEAIDRTRAEFHVTPSPSGAELDEEPVERLLLAILAAEESHRPLAPTDVVRAASTLLGPTIDAAELERAWTRLARGPECRTTDTGLHLTPAGERRLGLGAPTGASSESSEHRALLLRAFRVFARRGYAIEIVRQGRFDTTLPDGLFRQLGRTGRTEPVELARTLDRVRSGWAWRCFGGRDVHLEAEVSGALRPERIRHGWSKADGRGAFVLFLVGDPERARRVRRTLRSLGLRPDRAQVWTLRP